MFLTVGFQTTSSTLFPYTTLFRSSAAIRSRWIRCIGGARLLAARRAGTRGRGIRKAPAQDSSTWRSCGVAWPPPSETAPRSEEHTSELQSHVKIVCRLLLEKKKAD